MGIQTQAGQGISGDDAEVGEADARNEENDMDARLSAIWCQFLNDLMAKSPNPRLRSEASYNILTVAQQGNINEDLYKSLELPFSQVRYRLVTAGYWRTIFERLFPPRGTVLKVALQNYRQCQYFEDFIALCDGVSARDAQVIQKAAWNRFKHLTWMPMTSNERIWISRSAISGAHVKLPPGLTGPAPQIAINPNRLFYGHISLAARQDEAFD